METHPATTTQAAHGFSVELLVRGNEPSVLRVSVTSCCKLSFRVCIFKHKFNCIFFSVGNQQSLTPNPSNFEMESCVGIRPQT
jgi:hypothetical protein